MRFTPVLAAATFVSRTFAAPSYDCAGSDLCYSIPVKHYDQAVNDILIRNNDKNYRAGTSNAGVCFDNDVWGLGCRVFVRGGSHCKFSGNRIWEDYQEIRQSGCGLCGFKRYDNGCEVVVDYDDSCD